jgi:hypothetical protein
MNFLSSLLARHMYLMCQKEDQVCTSQDTDHSILAEFHQNGGAKVLPEAPSVFHSNSQLISVYCTFLSFFPFKIVLAAVEPFR